MPATTIAVAPERRLGQFLVIKPIVVEIDGMEVGNGKWSKTIEFATTPGAHGVTVSFPYLAKWRIGEAAMSITAVDWAKTELPYRTPWIVTNKGSLFLRFISQ
jgi:hypothetical protein